MAGVRLPTALELTLTLTGLIGKQVTVKAAAGAPALTPQQMFVGIYDDAKDNLETLWLSDIALCASLGAALTLVPAAMALEAIKAKKVSVDIAENAREVANIVANSFHDKRVRLVDFVAPAAPLPQGVADLMAGPNQRSDFTVDVAGYPAGKLTLMVAGLAQAQTV